MNKPASQTVLPWLKANLGQRCLAPLTSTDTACLRASVQIAEAMCYTGTGPLAVAWIHVVGEMQEHTRHLAYHAVAHVRDWSHRDECWELTGWPKPVSVCKFDSTQRSTLEVPKTAPPVIERALTEEDARGIAEAIMQPKEEVK